MKNHHYSLVTSALLFAGFSLHSGANVWAASFNEKCPDIVSCTKAVSEVTGQKYIFDNEIKGKVNSTDNVEFNAKNAELLFSHMLYLNGYTRVPLGQPHTYQILKIKDARDSTVPTVTADVKNAPSIPNHWDLYQMTYKAKNPESVLEISRILRNFMPANTRIIPSELNGTLIVTAAGPEVLKVYEMIRENDQKPTAALRKKWEDRSAASTDKDKKAAN